MFGRRTELQIPGAAEADPKSFEILRIWIAGGARHVSLKTEVWDDPATRGLMLADLACHVANAYAADGRDRSATLQRVCEGFRVEIDSPTDDPKGKVVD